MKLLFNKLFKRRTKELDTSSEQGRSETITVRTSYQPPKQEHREEVAFVYCLIGNIVEEHYNGQDGKPYLGTKHFSGGTKVYCFPPLWGDGYEQIKVIGRHRKSPRLVTMIIPSKRVTNWRVKTVYNPFVIKQMSQNARLYSTESHKEDLLRLAASLKA